MKRAILALTFFLCAANAFSQIQLSPGQQEYIFNANAGAAPQVGTVYSIPNQVNLLSWIVTFASAPGSQTTILECSNDNSVWATCDTSTAVAGEARTLFTSTRFVRATESARSGGGAITLTVIGKNSANPATGSSTFNNLTVTTDTSSSRYLAGDGTSAAPSYTWTNNTNAGMYNGGGFPIFSVGGNPRYFVATNSAGYTSNTALAWSSTTTNPTTTPDIGISRISAGTLGIGNGTQGNTTGNLLVGDGLVSAPSYSFGSAPTTGLYNVTGAPTMSITGVATSLWYTGETRLGSAGRYTWSSNANPTLGTADTGISRISAASIGIGNGTAADVSGEIRLNQVRSNVYSFGTGASQGFLVPAAAANFVFENGAATIGSQLKVDALPTIASGFGTSPSITAGSTPLAGSVNVGTGGAVATGVINFNGTAFPSAPFCTISTTTATYTAITAISTTQLTLTGASNWPASTIINWICISSK